MKHSSIRLESPCEFINVVPLNPLISKCQIKVCYVGDTPNRNRSIITKEVATKLANSLPGSPIVGYYKESEKDFDEHTRRITVSGGKFVLEDMTRPYGFVDLNAKCWFQKFLDDGQFEREYLMTEGYLWTGQYPECRRIITEGNNHSMELDKKIIDAYWTKDNNGKPEFFIINEALISKLCVLGEEEEPCFEGSTITSHFEFSFDESFKKELSSMIYQLQNFINEGGQSKMVTDEIKEPTDFKKIEDEEDKKKKEEKDDEVKTDDKEKNSEKQDKTEKEEKVKTDNKSEDTKDDEDEKKKKNLNFSKEEVCAECGKPLDECKCADKTNYSLEDIPEYVELQTQYSELETKFNELLSAKAETDKMINSLNEFKANVERKDKEAMINSFYMLSDEDKKEVVDNIDTYSLDDIEAKLSIMCVRNKVSFDLDKEKEENKQDPITYNLNSGDLQDDNVPAWVRAVRSVQNNIQ